MKHDWYSQENLLFLNPRLPVEEAAVARAVWADLVAGQLVDHIGLMSSGSSGQRKIILLSRRAILAAAGAVNRHLECTAEDIWLQLLPDFHIGGLAIWARADLSGSRVVDYYGKSGGDWDPQGAYDALVQSRASLTSVVPTQLYDLVKAGLAAPSTLRACVVGGGRLPSELFVRARALGWPVLPSFGMTELASQVATVLPERLIEFDNAQAAAAELEWMDLLPHVNAFAGAQGLLAVRSSAACSAVLSFCKDGKGAHLIQTPSQEWVTEDLVELRNDQRGRRQLRPLGRAQDFLKIGGESLHFWQLEQAWQRACAGIAELADLRATALFAAPDDRLGAQMVLLTTEAGELVEKAVDSYNKLVLPVARIRRIVRVSELPLSPLGKLQREKVLRLL